MSHHQPLVAPRDFIKQLRALIPLRQLTFAESFTLAERQAGHALTLVGATEPGMALSWLLELPRVEVRLAPRYRMERLSGMTTFTHGRYLIVINQNDTHARRRFTLAHEFKHLVDYRRLQSSTPTSATVTVNGSAARLNILLTISQPTC